MSVLAIVALAWTSLVAGQVPASAGTPATVTCVTIGPIAGLPPALAGPYTICIPHLAG